MNRAPFVIFRVWDKVISGSCKILVFVALEILLSYKIMLMGINRPEGVVKFLCNVSKKTSQPTEIRGACVELFNSPPPPDSSRKHGRHRDESHRLVAQILRHPDARRVAILLSPGDAPELALNSTERQTSASAGIRLCMTEPKTHHGRL